MKKPTISMEVLDSVLEDGTPYLFTVAESGDLDTLQYVLAVGKLSLNAEDANGKTMMHYAAKSTNVELIRFLVERCDMDYLKGDYNGVTPYQEAYESGNQVACDYFYSKCNARYEDMYQNPVRRGFFPDPSILRVGDDYYMVNSSFVFFPCIPISHSTDLIHWNIIGHAIVNPKWSRLGELQGGRGYWAPDISYCDGTFYITATLRLNDDGEIIRLQMVTRSDKPEGPYDEPSFIDFDGIDPSIFHEDGKHYMLLNRGARIAQLNEDCSDIVTEPFLLYYGDQKRGPEGPHLLKKDGYYYLLLAEGGTGIGHRITVARSTELMGIYEPCPYNPIMRQWDDKAYITRCGHGKLVQTALGDWYMVYLCGRSIEGKWSMLGRETAIDPVTWTADGWPIVNRLNGPSNLQVKPVIAEDIRPHHFDDDYRWNTFMTPREPLKDAFDFTENGVSIRPSEYPLSDMASRNILLRRQDSFRFSFEVVMTVPDKDLEAGITCYYDENTHLCYYIRFINGQYVLSLRERIGLDDIKHDDVVLQQVVQGDKIKLITEADYLKRRFSYSFEDVTSLTHTLDEVTYLCDEGIKMGKRFTGALVGMYAVGKSQEMVHFEDFMYSTIE